MERRLPDGWRLVALSGLVSNPRTDIVDGPFGSNLKASEYVAEGIPIIRLQNIERNSFLNKNLKYITNEKARELKRHNFSGGDIIITKLGSPLGKACLVPYGLNWGIIVADVVRVRPNENLVLKEYLVRAINSDIGARQFEPLTKGTTRPRVNLGNIRNLIVPIPSLETQRRIVAILDKAEETMRLRAQADELAARLTNNIFLKMVGNPIQNPKGWPKIKLGDLCEIRRGASPRPIDQFLGGTVPWIKIGDGTKGSDIYIEETEEKIIEKGVAKSVFLKEGSLIFANCGVSLGFARILKIDGCIHDGWLSLDEINPMLNKIYILKLINMLSTYFRKSAPDGTQPNLNTTIMKNFKVPVPPLDLQNKFAQIVNEVELFKQGQRNSKEKMDDFIGLLMQKAFSGELVA